MMHFSPSQNWDWPQCFALWSSSGKQHFLWRRKGWCITSTLYYGSPQRSSLQCYWSEEPFWQSNYVPSKPGCPNYVLLGLFLAGEGTNTSTLTHEYAAASGCLESYIVKSFPRSWPTPTGKTISLHMTVDHQVIAACCRPGRTHSIFRFCSLK